jgi:nicotinamidase-related amidase
MWNDIPLAERDRANFEKAGMGARGEPGEAPAIVIVDMNRAFSDSRFPLGDSDAAAPALEAIATLLAAARPLGVPIVYTTTFTTAHPSVKGRWKGRAGDVADPLLSSPEAHEIPAAIVPRADEPVLPKAKPSAFWQTGLADVLAYHRCDTLIVCGMTTSGCVRATVVDAFSHNLRVLVPQECVADRGELSHRVSLFDMDMKYADVLPTAEVTSYLGGLER